MLSVHRRRKHEVYFGDISLTQNPVLSRMNISMMPQLHAPLKGISIKQSVTAIGRIRGLSNGVLQQEVNEILQKLKNIFRTQNLKN